MAKHTLTIGRIVHFVTEYGPRPAMVVRVHRKDPDGGGLVNLQVFTDGRGMLWHISVAYDALGQAPGTWHWPDEARPEAAEAPASASAENP